MRCHLPTVAQALVLLLASCTFNAEIAVDAPAEGSSGSSGPGHTSAADVTGLGATSLDATGSSDESDGPTAGTESSGSSSGDSMDSTGEPVCHVVGPDQQCACDGVPAPSKWCEPCEYDDQGVCYCEMTQAPQDWCSAVCVLPHTATLNWCSAQRDVAQALGCKTSADSPACYQAIVAQYQEGDWTILAAGDCDTAIDDPACAEAYNACTMAAGSSACILTASDGVTGCIVHAVDSGMDEATATPWCEAMVAQYG